MMMRIHLKNLRLRTVIGVEQQERETTQDVIVNVTMDFDAGKAVAADDVAETVDYSALERRIREEAEQSSFRLLEKLASRILEIVMADPKVQRATVEVDKPGALKFVDSVSVSCRADRSGSIQR